jgi:hypothetical protein
MNCHCRETETERESFQSSAFLGVTASQRKEAQSGCVPLSSIDDTYKFPPILAPSLDPKFTLQLSTYLLLWVCKFVYFLSTHNPHWQNRCTRNCAALFTVNHIDDASTVSTKAHPMEGSHHHHKDPHCRKTSEHHSNHCKYGSNYHHHDKGSNHHHNISGPSQ